MTTSNPSRQVQAEHQDDIKQIKKECLRLLTRRDHSRKEIRDKLTVKGFDPKQVSLVVDELAQTNWQDDTRYAESYTRMRSHKGFGPVRIAFELRQQGITSDVVEKIVNSTIENWPTLLAHVYSKKYPLTNQMDSVEQARRSRFLLQRGFSSAMISELFSQLTKSQ
jgi:regulatory protein